MIDGRLEAIKTIVELWLAAPTDEPLVLDRDERAVFFGFKA